MPTLHLMHAARLGLVCATVAWLLPHGHASAQVESREGIALQNQILELRHDLEVLRQSGGAGGGGQYVPPPAAPGGGGNDITPQLLDRVSQLEDQVRQLRGRIDEVDNARQRSDADLQKQIGDLQFRLNTGAGSTPAAAPAPRPAPATSPPPGTLGAPAGAPPPPAPPTVRRTPEMALQAGTIALAQHDYAAAEADAREVLGGTKGPRTTDAQYLLAQALAGRRDYQAAAVAYDDAYARNARGTRAPDSLLGLANSLSAIGEKKAACQTLDKLRAEFPTPRPDLRAPIAASRTQAGCR